MGRFRRRLRWMWLVKGWAPKELGYVSLPSEVVVTPKIRATAERLARERGLI